MELNTYEIIKQVKILVKSEIDEKKLPIGTIKKLEDTLIFTQLSYFYDMLNTFIFHNNTSINRTEYIKNLFSLPAKSEYRKMLNKIYTRTYYKYQVNKDLLLVDYIVKKFNKYAIKTNKTLLKSLNTKYKKCN